MSLLLAILIVSFSALSSAYDWDEPTALDHYVNHDDGAFRWEELEEYRFDAQQVTVYVINMTSQYWMDASFSNAHTWWHYQAIAIPDNIRRNFAYEFIEGGNYNTAPPNPNSVFLQLALAVAAGTGYVASTLMQVPNQGVVFENDPDRKVRTEDDFISYTWQTFITTHQDQPEVIARMPMTKAGVRGLDAMRELVQQKRGITIDEFAVGGGSKRGWTAWSVAATDRRVVAVTPMVMSLLNFNDTLQAHFRSLGGWTWTFYDYWEKGLTRHFHDDIVTNWEYGLWTYEDPFRYKERLALIPKLLISAGGDQFFLPTDPHTWWDEMEGPKWIMMNPNAGHGLETAYENIVETLVSWLLLVKEPELGGVPSMVWLRGQSSPTTGRILLSAERTPSAVTAWVAHSLTNTPIRKDFREHGGFPPVAQDIPWTTTGVSIIGPGVYDLEVESASPAYTAFFIETQWNVVPGMTMRLTTEVHVTPDDYPFPECYGASCTGTLV